MLSRFKVFPFFFLGDPNPYQAEARSAEFFSCGFLQHTAIFVAESLVDEVTSLEISFCDLHKQNCF